MDGDALAAVAAFGSSLGKRGIDDAKGGHDSGFR
jgi:hypothetical protein